MDKWYQNLTAEDRRSWAMAEDDKRTLSQPIQIEKGKMTIEPWKRSVNRLFNPVILTNYKPLLRLQRAIGVRPLQIKTIRTEIGLVSSVGARLAQNALEVKWSEKSITEVITANAKGGEGPIPQAIPEDMFLTSSGNEIGYKNGNKNFKTAWQAPSPNSLVFPLALDPEFRYAFGLVRREFNGKDVVDQVVVVDVEQKKVADIISIPSVGMGASVIFDPTTEYLLILDPQWGWMMMLDLQVGKKR